MEETAWMIEKLIGLTILMVFSTIVVLIIEKTKWYLNSSKNYLKENVNNQYIYYKVKEGEYSYEWYSIDSITIRSHSRYGFISMEI